MWWKLLLLLELVCCVAALSHATIEAQIAQHLRVHEPEHLGRQKSESFADTVLRKAREYLNAQAYDEAISHMQHALKTLDEAQVNFSSKSVRVDDPAAVWLHFEYAELLRTRGLPGDQMSGAQLKGEIVSQYRKALAYADKLQKQSNAELEQLNPDQSGLTPAIRLHIWNTMGLLLLDLDEKHEALSSFQQALQVDPQAIEPAGNVILTLVVLGDMEGALDYTRRALEESPTDPRLMHNLGYIMRQDKEDDEAAEFWLHAMETDQFSVQSLCNLAAYFNEQGDFEKAVIYLNQAKRMARNNLADNPSDDSAHTKYNVILLKLAMARLPLIYESTTHIAQVKDVYEATLKELVKASESGLFSLPYEPLATIGLYELDYYGFYGSYEELSVHTLLARLYRNAIPSLSFVAPHVKRLRHKQVLVRQTGELPEPDVIILRRRVRVGFHISSFGITMNGVITGLPRDQFVVFLILDKSNTMKELPRELVTSVEYVVDVDQELKRFQQQVARLELDVLVFTDTGMRSNAYFLAFAQLALRTVLVWNDAVTSGIDTIDYIVLPDSLNFREEGSPNDLLELLHSSNFTECVYHIHNLSSFIHAPPPPLLSGYEDHARLASIRKVLGLPPAGTMFLVPQELHTIHPDSDSIIERILSELPTAFVVLPSGEKPFVVDDITSRWRRRLSGHVYKRIFFVQPLDDNDILPLIAMADIVLELFLIRGGRTIPSIFSIGAPIVVYAGHSTIYHLTAAMYAIMGIHGWVAHTDDQYVRCAVQLARNKSLRQELKQNILANKHKLFQSEGAVTEWIVFIRDILASRPPSQPGMHSAMNATHPLRSIANHSDIEYQLQIILPVVDQFLLPRPILLASLSSREDPFRAAEIFSAQFEPPPDKTHTAHLGKLLWNMRQRQSMSVVKQLHLSTLSAAMPEGFELSVSPLEIRYGDDLDQVVRWQILDAIKRQRNYTSLHDSGIYPRVEDLIADTTAQIKAALPEHRSTEWRQARSLISSSTGVQPPLTEANTCIALLVVTCKRLHLFLQTMAALAFALGITDPTHWSNWFCQLLVVDDNSSSEDRDLMRQRFPTFEFLFKTADQRGHAKSLQLAIPHIKSRFLFYLEDDRVADTSLSEACSKGKLHSSSGFSSCFLHEALAVFQHSGSEPVVLVRFDTMHRGWKKSITTPANQIVNIFVHEFAVEDIEHPFSHWPGFSFNPGLWDLFALRQGLQESDITLWFETNEDKFEEYFALRVWRHGLRVASLAEDKFADIGKNVSAYVLNGLPRFWDTE